MHFMINRDTMTLEYVTNEPREGELLAVLEQPEEPLCSIPLDGDRTFSSFATWELMMLHTNVTGTEGSAIRSNALPALHAAVRELPVQELNYYMLEMQVNHIEKVEPNRVSDCKYKHNSVTPELIAQ